LHVEGEDEGQCHYLDTQRIIARFKLRAKEVGLASIWTRCRM